MNIVNINGRTIKSNGNITISGSRVFIDGNEIETEETEKTINIQVDGAVQNLVVDSASEIKINGNVSEISSKNGNVTIIGNVSGNVDNKNGNIECADVGGDVTTKNGNIRHK
jgi:hypothetical protein